jgi:hypothetical protein
MSFRCRIGDSIFINDNGGGHRYVVISKPNQKGCIIIVNFTSASSCIDKTVTFTKYDDKNLFDHPTNVNYRYAQIISSDNLLQEAKRLDTVNHYFLCNEEIINKIVIGAFQSQFTPIEIIMELSIQYPEEYERYFEMDF